MPKHEGKPLAENKPLVEHKPVETPQEEPTKLAPPVPVNYEGSTTTTSVATQQTKAQVVKRVAARDPHLVVITPRTTMGSAFGDKWYDMQTGVQIAVTKDAAERFVEAGVADYADD